MWECEQIYDKEKSNFATFLTHCLEKKFATEVIARAREKRCNTEKDKYGKTKKDEKGSQLYYKTIL